MFYPADKYASFFAPGQNVLNFDLQFTSYSRKQCAYDMMYQLKIFKEINPRSLSLGLLQFISKSFQVIATANRRTEDELARPTPCCLKWQFSFNGNWVYVFLSTVVHVGAEKMFM